MHVGVEEAVAEHLGEEDLHAGGGELGNVHAGFPQALDLADRDALHAVHHHHVFRAPVPIHFGHGEQRRIPEIASELRAVGRLPHQIELVFQMFLELGDHLARTQAPAVGEQRLDQSRQRIEQADVVRDHRADAGAQHFHRDRFAVRQAREMHLRDRSRGDRHGVEFDESFAHGLAQGGFDGGDGGPRIERWHAVLQQRQFVSEIARYEVAPGGQQLAELDEDRPQRLQRAPQAHRARLADRPPEKQRAGQPAQRPGAFVAEDEFLQPKFQRDVRDADEAQQFHDPGRAFTVRAGRDGLPAARRRPRDRRPPR